MRNEFIENAFAKINVGLQVLPKRDDGFHDLYSIFQTVGVCDQLIVVYDAESESDFSVFCETMKLPEKNTLSMAFNAFCNVTGRELKGVSVTLKKNIPAGGGLGGGSSDGAALVRALERLTDTQLSDNQLDQIAAKTGSDVFFFVHCNSDGKGCALVSGRGEVVKPIQKRNDLHILLVFPEVFSSTAEAYARVDDFLATGDNLYYPDFDDYLKMYNGPVSEWKFANSFTPALAKRYSEIDKVLKCLHITGAAYAEMSGSGSTCYGIYESKERAEDARRYIVRSGYRCVVSD